MSPSRCPVRDDERTSSATGARSRNTADLLATRQATAGPATAASTSPAGRRQSARPRVAAGRRGAAAVATIAPSVQSRRSTSVRAPSGSPTAARRSAFNRRRSTSTNHFRRQQSVLFQAGSCIDGAAEQPTRSILFSQSVLYVRVGN